MVAFWRRKQAKKSQDGLQSSPKMTRVRKFCISENNRLDMLFTMNLEHRLSQETPKRAKKPLKTPPKDTPIDHSQNISVYQKKKLAPNMALKRGSKSQTK